MRHTGPSGPGQAGPRGQSPSRTHHGIIMTVEASAAGESTQHTQHSTEQELECWQEVDSPEALAFKVEAVTVTDTVTATP